MKNARLLAVILAAGLLAGCGPGADRAPPQAGSGPAAAPAAEVATIRLLIPGMTWGGDDTRRVRGALEGVEGVLDVSVSCASGTAVCTVRPDATAASLVSALDLEGFEANVEE